MSSITKNSSLPVGAEAECAGRREERSRGRQYSEDGKSSPHDTCCSRQRWPAIAGNKLHTCQAKPAVPPD